MQELYLDQSQCNKFNAPYFDAGDLVIAADALRKSKGGDGYDAKMSAYLKEADEDTLVLVRAEEDGPGWFKVTRVIPSWKRPKEVLDAFRAANGLA